jgi:hypothetical protein
VKGFKKKNSRERRWGRPGGDAMRGERAKKIWVLQGVVAFSEVKWVKTHTQKIKIKIKNKK